MAISITFQGKLQYGKLLKIKHSRPATDDLRESPHIQFVKRLLGEGSEIQIWDDSISLGRLVGSNRDYIGHFIPHIGSLLKANLAEVLRDAEVVVTGTLGLDRNVLQKSVRSDQVIIDRVNLEKARRLQSKADYKGICW